MTKYVIVNCNETEDPGIINNKAYDTYAEACKALEEDAQAFYEDAIPEEDRDECPLELNDGHAEFDYYGNLNQWTVCPVTV